MSSRHPKLANGRTIDHGNQRAYTTNEMSGIYKTLNARNDLNSATIMGLMKNKRETMSTRGGLGMSFTGSKSEFDEPPFLILPD